MGGKSGVAPDARDDRHRRARSRFRLRGHADLAAQTALADGDSLIRGQIDVVRHAIYFVVGDLGRARNIEDTALVIPHGSRHIYTAALVAGRVVADLTAVYVDGSAVIHAAAIAIAVVGNAATVHVERIGLSDVYTAAVIAGNNAAVHIELGSVTIHIHAAAIFPGGMRNTAAVPAICQGKHIRGISVYNDNISPHIITI